MDCRSQLDEFDPKDGRVPAFPFSLLPDIARRARLLLYRRSSEEIAAAAEMIDYVLNSYFDEEEQKFIDLQLKNKGWACKYLHKGACDAAGLRDLISRGLPDTAAEDDYFDYPTEDNTSELEALKICFDPYKFQHEGFRKPTHDEILAVLALCYIGACLHWFNRERYGQHQATNPNKGLRPPFHESSLNLSLGARDALMAMDAVCCAERLSEMARAEKKRQQLHRDVRQETRRADEFAEVVERRTAQAKKGGFTRHAADAEARERVIQYYEQHEERFRSLAAAAIEIELKLNVTVAHRTVLSWLSQFKKQRSSSAP